MPVRYTDDEIAALLAEPKIGSGHERIAVAHHKDGHDESRVVIPRPAGGEFQLTTRRSRLNQLDFSVILAFKAAGSTTVFRIRRHNGPHTHTNRIERTRLSTFHIHQATARYQDLGMHEDAYVESTSRFGDFQGALDCMLRDASFEFSRQGQTSLDFEPGSAE